LRVEGLGCGGYRGELSDLSRQALGALATHLGGYALGRFNQPSRKVWGRFVKEYITI